MPVTYLPPTATRARALRVTLEDRGSIKGADLMLLDSQVDGRPSIAIYERKVDVEGTEYWAGADGVFQERRALLAMVIQEVVLWALDYPAIYREAVKRLQEHGL